MNKVGSTLALIIITVISLSAQLNIKVGYEYNRMQEDAIANILSQYNSERPFLEAPMEEVKGRAGLALGMRYRFFQTSAIEFQLSRVTGDSEALGEENGLSFKDKLSSSSIYYSLGLENQIGMIGFGASIGYQSYKYKVSISNSNRKRDIMEENNLASRLYLNFEFPSDRISMTIQPYYQFSLGSYDFSPLRDELAPNSDIPDANLHLEPKSWGVTIALYNGRQK